MRTESNDTPRGWDWTSVGELGDVSGGVTKNATRTSLAIKLPYLRVANVHANQLRLDDITEIGVTRTESVRALLAKGDLLIVEGNGSIDQVGRVALWNGAISPCVHQNHIIKVRFGVIDLGAFVLYWFLSPKGREQVVRVASSTSGLHTLSLSKVASLAVPIAPLPEQRRIVAALDSYLTRVDEAETLLNRVQRNVKRYRAAVLQAAVEGRLVPTEAELARAKERDYEPACVLLTRIRVERRRRWEEAELARMIASGKPPKDDGWKVRYREPAAPNTTGLPTLPEGWVWASLESLTSAVRAICYGILMPLQHVRHGVPYVKVQDMRSGVVHLDRLSRTHPEIDAKYARSRLHAGDLLMAIRGTWGLVVDVPPELDGGNITQDSARLALCPELDRRYIKQALLSGTVQSFLGRVARGVAVKGVNIADLRATPVPVPPLHEQARIAEYVDDLLSIAGEAEIGATKNRARCARLRHAILRWAFEGRLVDQDSNDEPASVLLERIRAERSAAHSQDEKPRETKRAKRARA